MKHTDIKEAFTNKALIGTELTVCGWVRTSRDSKNMAFMELNDGTTLKHLQIVIDKSTLTPDSEALKLGASLKVVGTLVESRQESVEINAASIEVLGKSPAD